MSINNILATIHKERKYHYTVQIFSIILPTHPSDTDAIIVYMIT